MTIPELPWWPPQKDEELTEQQVWELLVYLLPRLSPVMDVAAEHIRELVAGAPIHFQLHYPTTRSLAGRRLGMFDVLEIAELSARQDVETVSISIGIRPDGQLATRQRRTFHVDKLQESEGSTNG